MKDSLRSLRREEIELLQAEGCSSDSWHSVMIEGELGESRFSNVHFTGEIRINKQSRPSVVCNATLKNVTLGFGLSIKNVNGVIENCNISDNVIIENVGVITCTPGSSFGNGTVVEVLSETGDRGVRIFEGLDSQMAYIYSLYKYDKYLINALDRIIDAEIASKTETRSLISKGAIIRNTTRMTNVKVGPFSIVDSALCLENGTIVSTETFPAHIGPGVIMRNFIVNKGTVVEDNASIYDSYIGQACHVGRGFTSSHSLIFSNSHFENGESAAMFALPYSVSHHKSSLMIGGLYSFMNAGSATNFSNHLYKAGPIHYGLFDRGVKFASGSYTMLPVHIGAFSTVMGHHKGHPDTSHLPFSYIVESEDGTSVIPGVSFSTVGLYRDTGKWPSRDKRDTIEYLDSITFDVLSPYTVERMLQGISFLQSGEKGIGYSVSERHRKNGVSIYTEAMEIYFGALYLNHRNVYSSEDENDHIGNNWVDIGGLIAPASKVSDILTRLKNGKISSVSSLRYEFNILHELYRSHEWSWAISKIRELFSLCGELYSEENYTKVSEIYRKSYINHLNKVLKDAEKEYNEPLLSNFGADSFGSESVKEADLIASRGLYEENKIVKEIREELKRVSSLQTL